MTKLHSMQQQLRC